jgi:hypothetical protein
MAERSLNTLSLQQLEKLKSSLVKGVETRPERKLQDLSIDQLEDLKKGLEKKQESEVTALDAMLKLGAKGAAFGATGFAAGVGGGLGAIVGKLEEGIPFEEALEAGREAFLEARKERVEEEKVAKRAFPALGTAAEIGGAIATGGLGLARLGPIAGGAVAGGLGGLGAAVSEAERLEEVPEEALTGAALGAGFGAVSKIPGALAKTAIGRQLTESAKKAMDASLSATRKAFVRTGRAITGVAEKDIDTFLTKFKKVASLMDDLEATDDAGAAFIDEKKDLIFSQMKAKKDQLNAALGKAIRDAEGRGPGMLPAGVKVDAKRDVDIRPIVNDLFEETVKLDPVLQDDVIRQVAEGIIDPLMKAGGRDGRITLSQLQIFKQRMQDLSQPIFKQAQQGKLFSDGKVASKLTTKIANRARVAAKNVMDEKLPAVKGINKKLSELHELGNDLKPLLRETAPVSRFTALARQEGKNRQLIKKVDELVGEDFLSEFEELAAAKTFGRPALLPVDVTGKSLTRLLAGTAGGAAIGELTGADMSTAAAIGAIATSPAALKQLIKGKALSQDALKSLSRVTGLAKVTVDNADQAFQALGRALASVGAQQTTSNRNDAIKRRLQFQ